VKTYENQSRDAVGSFVTAALAQILSLPTGDRLSRQP